MKAFTVAKWEYLEKVKTKTFLASLIITPAIMVAFGVLPSLFAMKPDTETQVIGVVDETGSFAGPLDEYMTKTYKLANGSPNYAVRALTAPDDAGFASAKKLGDSLALSESIQGYVTIGKNVLTDSTVDYRSKTAGNIRVAERLETAIHTIIVQKKLKARGIDSGAINDLSAKTSLKTIKLTAPGKEEEAGFEKVFIPAYLFMMMMFMIVVTSGQMLVRSMLEEKSSRVVEVLLSSCTAEDLMAGKVVGLSGLGLTQLAVWLTIGMMFNAQFVAGMFTPLTALYLFIYFALGYLLYAAIFVALGSPVSTEQEAQQMTQYLLILLVIPMAVVIPVMENPNSMMAHVLSFVPVLTPTMMAMRIAVEVPPPWEIAGTSIVLGLSAWLMMKAAGKIFRTAILMQGKRPSLAELLRIVRAS